MTQSEKVDNSNNLDIKSGRFEPFSIVVGMDTTNICKEKVM